MDLCTSGILYVFHCCIRWLVIKTFLFLFQFFFSHQWQSRFSLSCASVYVCVRCTVSRVTSKRASLRSCVVISVNEACNGGVWAHDLLIVNTLFHTHTCFRCAQLPSAWLARCGGSKTISHESFLTGDVQEHTGQMEVKTNSTTVVLQCRIRCLKSVTFAHFNNEAFAEIPLRTSPPESAVVFFTYTCFSITETCWHTLEHSESL